MPHTRSAKKRLRQDEKRRLHNRSIMKAVRRQIKTLLDTLEKGTAEEIDKEFRVCAKKLDRAGHKRVLHPNKVSRRKSKLAKLVHEKLNAEKAPASE